MAKPRRKAPPPFPSFSKRISGVSPKGAKASTRLDGRAQKQVLMLIRTRGLAKVQAMVGGGLLSPRQERALARVTASFKGAGELAPPRKVASPPSRVPSSK